MSRRRREESGEGGGSVDTRPLLVPGLIHRWQVLPQFLVLNAGNITTIVDRMANADASAAAAANEPTLNASDANLNGRPSAQYQTQDHLIANTGNLGDITTVTAAHWAGTNSVGFCANVVAAGTVNTGTASFCQVLLPIARRGAGGADATGAALVQPRTIAKFAAMDTPGADVVVGTTVASTAVVAAPAAVPSFVIGCISHVPAPLVFAFNGSIAETLVYNRRLTVAEMAFLYNAYITPTYGAL